MYNFVFHMPAKVLFGPGKLQTLHEETLPGKKALIVTTNGTSVKKYKLKVLRFYPAIMFIK